MRTGARREISTIYLKQSPLLGEDCGPAAVACQTGPISNIPVFMLAGDHLGVAAETTQQRAGCGSNKGAAVHKTADLTQLVDI